MFEIKNKEIRNYKILWDQIGINPSIQLKTGIKRKRFPLTKQFTKNRSNIYYVNNYVELKGKWDNSPGFGSLLNLKLKNISDSSIRITRLVFPAENGLDKFLKGFESNNISFLRNGYQSWSTSKSYRLKEKPLRPWLQLVSLVSSNMANLPSNTPGNLSSEMHSVISDLKTGNSFLVGQTNPFNQFFYIRLILYKKEKKTNYFELVYDFGRKMVLPGETIKLDGIIMAQDQTTILLEKYYKYINSKMKINILNKHIKGWCTWYYYFNKISPEIIEKNISILKYKKADIDFIQIDDGYQKFVGDWLDLKNKFNGRMKEISNVIQEAGYIPGIWIAPFIADKKSELVKIHPEYTLKNEYGSPLKAGYNPIWPGKFYYGLDITNPRLEEYIRKVIRTYVHEWGFSYLKLDFLFGGCLRGGTHHNLNLTKAEVLKYGMKIIQEEAGKNVIINGCGMPISTGIGNVDFMRVGPDTGPFWNKVSGSFLHTGAMNGAKNSIRNFMARSMMNKYLWINDPDCLMIRRKKTNLNSYQRLSQINAIILSGGLLTYSDDFSDLTDKTIEEINKINQLSKICFNGNAIACDLMENPIPEIYYNTSGFIGIFNFKKTHCDKEINLKDYNDLPGNINYLKDVWTGEIIKIKNNNIIKLTKMHSSSSRLFEIKKI